MAAAQEAFDSLERDNKGAKASVADDEAKFSDDRILVSRFICLARL